MPKQYAKPEPTPIDSGLISFEFEDLAKRWGLNIHVTKRTVRSAGLPIVRLSFKTLRLRMIDVLKHVTAQRELLTCGLESEVAKQILAKRPTVEALMPSLQLGDLEKKIDDEIQAENDRKELPWDRRR